VGDPLYSAAREYLAAEDAYQAAADRPIDDTLDVHGWVRGCDAARDRVIRARATMKTLLDEAAAKAARSARLRGRTGSRRRAPRVSMRCQRS